MHYRHTAINTPSVTSYLYVVQMLLHQPLPLGS
jgi:hypothetical protein